MPAKNLAYLKKRIYFSLLECMPTVSGIENTLGEGAPNVKFKIYWRNSFLQAKMLVIAYFRSTPDWSNGNLDQTESGHILYQAAILYKKYSKVLMKEALCTRKFQALYIGLILMLLDCCYWAEFRKSLRFSLFWLIISGSCRKHGTEYEPSITSGNNILVNKVIRWPWNVFCHQLQRNLWCSWHCKSLESKVKDSYLKILQH